MKSGRLGKKSLAMLLCITILLGNVLFVHASELGSLDVNEIVTSELQDDTEMTEVTEETEVTEVKEIEEETQATEEPEVEEETQATEVTEIEEEKQVTEVTEIEEETQATEEPEVEEETQTTEETETAIVTEVTEGMPQVSVDSTLTATWAATTPICLVGLADSSNNQNAVIKDSAYLEIISDKAPDYSSWTDSYFFGASNKSKHYLKIVVALENEESISYPTDSSKYFQYSNLDQAFTIQTGAAYELSSVAYCMMKNGTEETPVTLTINSDGQYECTLQKLNGYGIWEDSYINELIITLSPKKETPEDLLKVTNTVSNRVNGQSVEDLTAFTYIIKKDGTPLAKEAYTYEMADGTLSDGMTDEEGTFALKGKEAAIFKTVEGTYTVTELLQDGYETCYSKKIDKVETEAVDPVSKTPGIETLEATHSILAEMNQQGRLYQVDFYNTKNTTELSYVADKTATLVDWEDRTYDIQISASSETLYYTGGDTIVTENKPAVDVVLVLDVSGSMRGTSLTNLKTASKNFVDGLYKNADANSTVAIVTFDTAAKTVQELISLNENNISTVKEKIDAIIANGGTNQAEGLKLAQTLIEEGSNAAKYVVLFTDGKPDTVANTSSEESQIADEAYKTAEQIKKEATIYTVRLGNFKEGNLSYGNLTKRSYEEWLTDLATDASHALSATSSDQLKQIFETIKNEVTTPVEAVVVPISGVTICDTLDQNFELTEGEKERLEGEGATVTVVDGMTTITWENQTLPAANKDNDIVTPGWCRSIHVKAKDAYIGGNNVPTNNREESFVSINDTKEVLPQPAVNVKVDFAVNDHTEEIFLGETIPTEEAILNQLFADKDSYECTWYQDAALTEPITVEEMASVTPGIDGKEYYLKVAYHAGTPSEESNANTLVAGEATYNGSEENGYQVEKTATYTIRVLSGELTITKQINAIDYKKEEGDPIFTFQIVGVDTGVTYYKTLRFSDVTGSGVVTRETTITGLSKDTYTITELSSLGYQLTEKWVGFNGATLERITGAVEIGLGEKREEQYVTNGKVLFVNEKARNSGKLTDTDVIKNSFVLQEAAEEEKTSAHADNNLTWDAITATVIKTGREDE